MGIIDFPATLRFSPMLSNSIEQAPVGKTLASSRLQCGGTMVAMVAYLPPLLAPGLRLVLVGTEPGRESLRLGCYYADLRNSFWSDLFAAGLTPRLLQPCAYAELLTLGIGLDDVYSDPRGLRKRIEGAKPRVVCFNSRMALERIVGEVPTSTWRGQRAGEWVSFQGVDDVWALPDSSGRAAGYRDERRSLLRELRTVLA